MKDFSWILSKQIHVVEILFLTLYQLDMISFLRAKIVLLMNFEKYLKEYKESKRKFVNEI